MVLYGQIKDTKISLNRKKIILKVEIDAFNFIEIAKKQKEKTKSEKHIYRIIKENFIKDMQTSTLKVTL